MESNNFVYTFGLSAKQMTALQKWKVSLPPLESQATAGGAFTFKFTPTGLGTHVIVERVDGLSINLDDYSNW